MIWSKESLNTSFFLTWSIKVQEKMLQANPKTSHPQCVPKRPEECLKAQDLDVAWEITDLRGLCQCSLHEQ